MVKDKTTGFIFSFFVPGTIFGTLQASTVQLPSNTMSDDKQPGFLEGLKEKAEELLEKAEEAIEGVVGEERVEKVKEVLTTDVRDIVAGAVDKVEDVTHPEDPAQVEEEPTTDVPESAADMQAKDQDS
jgi:hypothetical protein